MQGAGQPGGARGMPHAAGARCAAGAKLCPRPPPAQAQPQDFRAPNPHTCPRVSGAQGLAAPREEGGCGNGHGTG